MVIINGDDQDVHECDDSYGDSYYNCTPAQFRQRYSIK